MSNVERARLIAEIAARIYPAVQSSERSVEIAAEIVRKAELAASWRRS